MKIKSMRKESLMKKVLQRKNKEKQYNKIVKNKSNNKGKQEKLTGR